MANLGDPASPYLDMIASIAANDPDPYVRDQAAMSVAQLQAPSINALAPDADASPVDDSLRSVLEIRSHIAQGSGTGDAAEMLGKAYLSAVPSPDTAMLENIVPGDADVGDLFAHRTDKKSAAVIRGQAIEGLRDLGSDAVGGLPYLIIATSDPTPWVRAVSAETIGNLGSEAGDAAVPYLVKMLEDQDSYVQQTALQALRKLAPP